MSAETKTRGQELVGREGDARSSWRGGTGVGFARRYDIDWLRVLAVLLLFPFHTLRVYNAGEAFYVKGAHLSVAVNVVTRLHRPLAHAAALPAGRRLDVLRAAASAARGSTSGERVKRLAVPFVFGVLVLVPAADAGTAAASTPATRPSYWSYIDERRLPQVTQGRRRLLRRLRHRAPVVHPGAARHRGRRAAAAGVGTGRARRRACMRSISRRLARPVWWLLRAVRPGGRRSRCPIPLGLTPPPSTTWCSSCSAT